MARFSGILKLAATLVACSVDFENQTDESAYLKFPEDFLIGVSTAAYQTEGAWNVSGKGVSVWDHYVHTNSSRIVNKDNGDVACDSYNKYKEDVALIKELGFAAYRLSVSWTRILPTGFANVVSREGIEHYKRIIDELLANNIEPIVTMIHYDHPQILEDYGGWTNEMMVDWFGDYARVLYKELGPKVKKWITVNEPAMHCLHGYGHEVLAPGKIGRGVGEYLCVHNYLMAHARAYRIYQDEFKSEQNGVVGPSLSLTQYYPKNPETDKSAADTAHNFMNAWLLHPIFSKNGDYHDVLKRIAADKSRAQGFPRSKLPELSEQWIEYIRGTADFLGINHYTSVVVEPGEDSQELLLPRDLGLVHSADPSWEQAPGSWLSIVPQGFGDLLRKVAAEYGNPIIYITENGIGDNRGLNDPWRSQYFYDYLKELLVVMNRDHLNVKGYIAWSLLDNFEWILGYSQRFGIVQVDFNDPQRKRTLKQSAYWWKRVTATRRLWKTTA